MTVKELIEELQRDYPLDATVHPLEGYTNDLFEVHCKEPVTLVDTLTKESCTETEWIIMIE